MVAVGTNAAIYGFIAWMPTFFVKQGLSVVTSLGYSTLMSLGGPLGAVIPLVASNVALRLPTLVPPMSRKAKTWASGARTASTGPDAERRSHRGARHPVEPGPARVLEPLPPDAVIEVRFDSVDSAKAAFGGKAFQDTLKELAKDGRKVDALLVDEKTIVA